MPVDLTLRLEPHRRALFQLCYRMTGSASDAEDLVQETFLRALRDPPADLARPLRPWLMRVAMNLARDALRARKRTRYRGPWLPEPMETDALIGGFEPAPEARYGERESVTFAFLTALEGLSPTQRAVLLLRDVLDYSVLETAHVLAISVPNVKSTHHRARAALASYDASRVPLTPARRAQVEWALRAFCVHLATGNVAALEALLAADVCAVQDGNGEFIAAQVPIVGRERVLRFHLKVMRRVRGKLALRDLNGVPTLVCDVPSGSARIACRSVVSVALDARARIHRIDAVVATAKLRHVDFEALPSPGLREALLFLGAAVLRALAPIEKGPGWGALSAWLRGRYI